MSDTAIKIEGLKKQYKLGTIGGGTLSADLQTWWAKVRGKENPNATIGEDTSRYGEKFWALNGINLEVKKGEAVGIIGHNGAGKSTLLKILSRVTAPTEGTVRMKGRVSSMLEVGTGFHPELTGRENIYMNGAILGMSRKEVDAKIEEIIDFSECRQFIDTPVKRYSSGMYVKLAFAVAAHLDAEILIMDEVLAVGDVKFQKKCLGRMGTAANEEGKTVLYVSHNMSTIRQLCTRCIVLNHGQVVFDGGVEDAIAIYMDFDRGSLKQQYDLSEVARPSKDHGMNFVVRNLTISDREVPTYKIGEELKFHMTYSATQDYEGLGIYYTVQYEDSSVVGTTQTMSLGNIRAGEEKSCNVTMSLAGIVPGRYYFYLDVFYGNQYGTFFSIDHPLQKIYFEVEEDTEKPGIQWRRRYFGSVRLPDLKVEVMEKGGNKVEDSGDL